MYSLHFYGRMIADASRMDAYVAALGRFVRTDSVVMDLGCGPGVFALLACKLGARRVYAVEPDNVIGLAREAAVANGFADRIEFFENLSTEITVPERADIIVSDLRGVLPWYQQHIPSIIDARERLLARGGVLIPRRDILWAAVVEAPEQYEELVGPWEHNKIDLDLSAGARMITNTWRKAHIKQQQLLSEPVCWTTLNYYDVDSPDICAEISWRASRSGIAHGVAVWFDADLADGVGFSNHPQAPQTIYGNGLFPFAEPVEIAAGERIDLRLSARMVHDDYLWRWETDFLARDDDTHTKRSFKQSTFFGVPLSAEGLRKLRQ
ncbi:MAG TPA: class I SAM-dependent methyltransferase [Pyrinomonadaceae bacterium]|nr:class I SAM-dependent methyltransferase [Pyrinomonadaceae bacterium]